MRFAVFAVTVVTTLLAHQVQASTGRGLLQAASNVPTFQGTGLSIVNAADAAATQTSPSSPRSTGNTASTAPFTDSSTGAPVPALETPVLPQQPIQVPARAPVTPVLPVVNTPAPQPSVQPPPSPPQTVPAPQPAAARPPSPPPQAPVPAPVNPPVTAPTPAPLVLPVIRIPVPAPQPVLAAVPAPAPQAPPQCGVQPQCRLFLEDMLCCDSVGTITNKQHAVMRLQCTHPVNYYPKCFNVSGPANKTAFNQFETTVWSTSHKTQVQFLEEYIGNVTVDIEGPRINGILSADCGLYISPCEFKGNVVTKVAPVQGLSFTTMPSEDFLDVSSSVSDDINNLDNFVMPNLFYPSACQQQNVGELDADFFTKDWATYAGGFMNQCNYTAFQEAMPSSTQPVASGSVQTASLG